MKFPRNVRMSHTQLDAAPFAGVLFCLLIFVLLCSLVYTPGVLINLPASNTVMPDVEGPKISVALDPNGTFYYENQIIQESNLVQQLKLVVARQSEPVTLVVMADKNVTTEQWIHVGEIADKAKIRTIQQRVLSRVFDAPPDVRMKP